MNFTGKFLLPSEPSHGCETYHLYTQFPRRSNVTFSAHWDFLVFNGLAGGRGYREDSPYCLHTIKSNLPYDDCWA